MTDTTSRFAQFTEQERAVLHDGLMEEASIDPDEDPSYPPWVETAKALLVELEAAGG